MDNFIELLKSPVIGWVAAFILSIVLKKLDTKWVKAADILTDGIEFMEKQYTDFIPDELEKNLLTRPKAVIDKELKKRGNEKTKKVVDKVLKKKNLLGKSKRKRGWS